MRIPTKITPDRIRDSIVQVFFSSDIPYIPLIGYFHSYLLNNGKYEYIGDRNSGKNEIDLSFLNHLFVNSEAGVKISIHPNKSIIFNCTENYIGWTNYEKEIETVLNQLISVGIIKEVTRVGVRYTSEFPNIDILEKVNFGYNHEIDGIKIKSEKFTIECSDDNFRVIINLVSNAQVNPFMNIEEEVHTLSIIDIDVINEKISQSDVKEVMSTIFNTHEKQKLTFFNLLKNDFISELNPEYE